jgi:hypothetical protein
MLHYIILIIFFGYFKQYRIKIFFSLYSYIFMASREFEGVIATVRQIDEANKEVKIANYNKQRGEYVDAKNNDNCLIASCSELEKKTNNTTEFVNYLTSSSSWSAWDTALAAAGGLVGALALFTIYKQKDRIADLVENGVERVRNLKLFRSQKDNLANGELADDDDLMASYDSNDGQTSVPLFDKKNKGGAAAATNPAVAFRPETALKILKALKYGMRLETESDGGFQIKLYRVESLENWLKSLYDVDCQNNYVLIASINDGCKPLSQHLGSKNVKRLTDFFKREEAKIVLSVLDLCVWIVNQNPQLLNPEYRKEGLDKQAFPSQEPDKTFNMYGHLGRVEAKNKLSDLCEDIRRMVSLFHNGLGLNYNSWVQTVGLNYSSLPSSPLNPLMFERGNGLSFISPMQGMLGGAEVIADIHQQLANQSFGHTLVQRMFNQLLEHIKTIGASSVAEKSINEINEKLAKLKSAELNVNRSIADLHQKVKLYTNSHGHVNTFDMESNSPQFQQVLKKYAENAGLPQMFNQVTGRTNQLLEVLLRIAEHTRDNADKIVRPLGAM